MATISDKTIIDNLIANDGFYIDEDGYNDPQVSKIVEYTNQFGKVTWGIVYPHENQDRYIENRPYVNNPKVIWQRRIH